MGKRHGNLMNQITSVNNFIKAVDGATKGKHNRSDVANFMCHLDENIEYLRQEVINERWTTSSYTTCIKHTPKERVISKLPLDDHIVQWSVCNVVEPIFVNSFYSKTYSCITGKGTHAFFNDVRHDMFSHSENTSHYLQMDIHHFFLNIDHDILKLKILKKIKDKKVIRLLFDIIDSWKNGVPLGIKISQLFGNIYLSDFDFAASEFFGITKDIEKLNYYSNRYIEHRILSAKTIEDEIDISKGPEFLRNKFIEGLKNNIKYYRFADDLLFLSNDKSLLSIIRELSICYLAHKCLLSVNKSHRISPVYPNGIDICGYVIFNDHTLVRKRNKKGLCKLVYKLRKSGLSDNDIYLKCATRIGFVKHANAINLIKKLRMERLGKIIKKRKAPCPFEGLTQENKVPIESIIYKDESEEVEKLILLLDYKILKSKITNSSNNECIAFKFKKIKDIVNGEPVFGNDQYYTFSGSKVLTEQGKTDFSPSDLPCITGVKEIFKNNKKFYKFT